MTRKITRRHALQLLGNAVPALYLRRALAQTSASRAPGGIDLTPGRFSATRESLRTYTIPAWFADAKFGIWSHWGPQSAIGDGDWYARNMYREGSDQYLYHVKRFGHPSKVGYKDTIPLFTAAHWDPDHLIDLYVKAGAKYFFSMGVHHDNYDLWNSKYQPHWNSVSSGPKKDIVGLWATAARKRNLRFGVSEHLSNSFDWFAPAHLSDTKGPLAGVPYDGADPHFRELYHDYEGEPANFAKTAEAMGRVAPERWKLQYFRRVKDLIDQHHPDLLYTDGGIPFSTPDQHDQYGLATVAELYNAGPKAPDGSASSVYFSKEAEDSTVGTCALDRERGVTDNIWPTPWQTDTCIGDWHYKLGQRYKSSKKVVDLLVDIVSKNGNLLLNLPLPASGELDPDELQTLDGITRWMAVNSEGIYSSRPWKIFGEGPALSIAVPSQGFNESKKPDLGPADIRFTTKGANTLYAFVQGWPEDDLRIKSLATSSPQQPARITGVHMLGHDAAIKFTQDATALRVTLPQNKPATADLGIALRISFA